MAINSQLLESSIDGAKGIIVNITGSSNMTLYEINDATNIINNVVNELLSNSEISVATTQEVAEAFAVQSEKVNETVSIFKSLHSEIKKVRGSIEGINEEVGDLETHKNVIESGIDALSASSEENSDSAQLTTENLAGFKETVSECGVKTKRVVGVTEELIGYIH